MGSLARLLCGHGQEAAAVVAPSRGAGQWEHAGPLAVELMNREEIEAGWKDPRHWKWHFYYCPDDPRAIVPKRVKWMG